ncbi:hypothetical protein [Demequina subtropica]|uniref:hypothetical protein n=1 Tax=Demequina subtropica TaxID=1638989 RepID=UPI000785E512|nr:hypothetical protein [Demequina subtropica]
MSGGARRATLVEKLMNWIEAPHDGGPAGRFFGASARVERWIGAHPWAMLGAGIVAVALTEATTRGLPGSWDWVWVSGTLAVCLGLPWAYRLVGAAERCVERLVVRGVLEGPADELGKRTARAGDMIGRLLGPLVAGAIGGGFLTRAVVATEAEATVVADKANNLAEILLACLAGYLVGRATGVVLGIAMLGGRIQRGAQWTLTVQPGHGDGAAGMRPVGDLFLKQAAVVAVPAVWLVLVLWGKSLAAVGKSGWAAMAGFAHLGTGWGDWYFALLPVAIALEIAAFILPMVAFHRSMTAQKRVLESKADRESKELVELEDELRGAYDDATRATLRSQISAIRARGAQIAEMPTWPVDTTVRRRFTVRNAILLFPIVLNALGKAVDAETWKTVGDVFG